MHKTDSKSSMDWDAYRYFVTVADEGSLSAAARLLTVTQPTVSRRIRDLEENLGVKLFEREVHGYALTDVGRSVLGFSRGMLEKAVDIERYINDLHQPMTEKIRIAAPVGLGIFWLPQRLQSLRDRLPAVDIEVQIGMTRTDLNHREADLALRVGQPGSEDLIKHKITTVSSGIYAADSYLEENGEPKEIADLQRHIVIESTGSLAQLAQARHLRKVAPNARVSLRSNSLTMQITAACNGLGLLALPTYVGQAKTGLRRVLADLFDLPLDIWLLSRRDSLSTTSVRTVFDFLTQEMRRDPLVTAIHQHQNTGTS